MSLENPFWGATKIHGELLKLDIQVAQSTVSIYMVPRQDRPLQTWKTFLRNHMEGIASIDLFVVPTIAFEQLFAFLVLGHGRRRLLWIAVTRNPTAEWLARQITEAFPWDWAPIYVIRDNDRAFGIAFKDRVRAMGIRDRPISFRSPWQNGYVERLIGSIRRECTDHLIVFNAEHLRRILAKYTTYYNEVRTHVSLGKDAPCRRPIEQFGNIVAYPILGGATPSIRSNLVFRSDNGVGTAFYYEDPDQNIVELNVNNYGNEWTATEHMKTSPPDMTYVDPDKMIAARKAGASPWELHERAFAGEFAPTKPYRPAHTPLNRLTG
jgi:integrase-like protein